MNQMEVGSNHVHVIEPKSKWFSVNLQELWAYRDLMFLFVKRDIVANYKQTVLGPLWFFISPLLTIVVYTVFFGGMAKISTDGIPAPLFYLSGIILWNYFQECLSTTSSTFIKNANVFGKVYFPRLISPISVAVSTMLKLLIQFSLFIVFYFFYRITGDEQFFGVTKYVLLAPFLVIMLGFLSVGSGILISSLTTKYRDLTYFVSYGLQLLMFSSPVIYPVSAISEKYQSLYLLNPIAPIIEAFRYALTGVGTVSPSSLMYSACFTFVVFVVGLLLFSKTERNFIDTV